MPIDDPRVEVGSVLERARGYRPPWAHRCRFRIPERTFAVDLARMAETGPSGDLVSKKKSPGFRPRDG